MSYFNRKKSIIKFLKDNAEKEYTAPEIAAWIAETYPEEVTRKEQTSKNKQLRVITNKVARKQFVTQLFSREFTSVFRKALQKMEPRIKITEEYQPKYCYIDKGANHEFAIHDKFDIKNAVITFLKDNSTTEFTSSQIAKKLIDNYSDEIDQKMQASTDKRLLNIKNKTERKKIIIKIYAQELKRILSSSIPKIEPKIKIMKKGGRLRYCYVNSYEQIVNQANEHFDLKNIVIKFLQNSLNQEFTSSQIAKWIVTNYPEETEQKRQTTNIKLLVSANINKEDIAILLYEKEIDKTLRLTLQETEPKIKIIKKGWVYKYCYIDNTDKIFDKLKVIKTLKNHSQQKFTAIEMAQLLLGTNPR